MTKPMVEGLKSILAKQKEAVSSLESEISNIEANDLVAENRSLKDELERNRDALQKEKTDNIKLAEENKRLKNLIFEQLYSEKLRILSAADTRIEIYFRSSVKGEVNRLKRFEADAIARINAMVRSLEDNKVELTDEIYTKLNELRKLLEEKVRQAQDELLRQAKSFNEKRAAELSGFRQEQIKDEEVKGRLKQNNLEALIGLNITNKLGILFLIIGVITASQYTYNKLPNTLRGVFVFALGIIMLIAGELMNRRRPDVFSLGITSGGVAVLYVALAISYFSFGILGMYQALGLCILITAVAFALSQRYNSQTISAFALIGGYLPIFSISGSKAMVYGAMIYFVILNLLAVIISGRKKWTATAFTGFVLNTAGSMYILSIVFGSGKSSSTLFDSLAAIIYITFAFVSYTLIPVIGTYRKKLSFLSSDIVLLTLNTFISALLLYAAFYAARLSDFTGLLSVMFTIVYLALGRFVESKMDKERRVKVLFYITSLTFAVLTVPFQFGRVWVSLGWLIEGTAILSYGIIKEMKDFKKAGAAICGLCLAAFVLIDVPIYDRLLFTYQYLSITAGSLVIQGVLIYKKQLSELYSRAFKYATAINLWFFLLYLINSELWELLRKLLAKSSFDPDYLVSAAMILASFVMAYFIPRIKILYDSTMKVISMIIYVIAIAALIILNSNSPVRGSLVDVPVAVSIVGTLELAVIALLSVLAVRDLLLSLVAEQKLGIEWYPFILSLYFVIILTQNLVSQYRLEFNNAIITIIYLVTALAWITFGFVKKYVLIRRYGLGLTMLSVGKLFLVDLEFLSQGYRIISYFVFGLTLIAISFVYQYFSKRVEG